MTLIDDAAPAIAPGVVPVPRWIGRRILVAAVAVALVAGGVGGAWWSDSHRYRPPPGKFVWMRVLASDSDRGVSAIATAVSMATGLQREDGLLYGEWAKLRVHRLCPDWPTSDMTFVGLLNTNGDGTGHVAVNVGPVPNKKVVASAMCRHFKDIAWVRGPVAEVVAPRSFQPDPKDDSRGIHTDDSWLGEFLHGDAP